MALNESENTHPSLAIGNYRAANLQAPYGYGAGFLDFDVSGLIQPDTTFETYPVLKFGRSFNSTCEHGWLLVRMLRNSDAAYLAGALYN